MSSSAKPSPTQDPGKAAQTLHYLKKEAAYLADNAGIGSLQLLAQLLERAPHHLAVAAKLVDARVDGRKVALVQLACTQAGRVKIDRCYYTFLMPLETMSSSA